MYYENGFIQSSSLILLSEFLLAGTFLKAADTSPNGRLEGGVALIGALVSGVIFGLLISTDQNASAIMLGIMIGVGLANKIDAWNLKLGVAVSALTALLSGFCNPDLLLLTVVSVASYLDEFLHDRFGHRQDLLGKLALHRGVLKVMALALAVASAITVVHAIGVLLFDLGYEGAGIILGSSGMKPKGSHMDR